MSAWAVGQQQCSGLECSSQFTLYACTHVCTGPYIIFLDLTRVFFGIAGPPADGEGDVLTAAAALCGGASMSYLILLWGVARVPGFLLAPAAVLWGGALSKCSVTYVHSCGLVPCPVCLLGGRSIIFIHCCR